MAEGILAQLKVILGLDSAKLSKGLDESAILAKKSAGKIQGEFRSLAGSIERLFAPLGKSVSGPIGSALSAIGASAGEATRKLGSLGGSLAVIGGVGTAAVVGLGAGMFALAVKAAEVGAKIFDASEKTGISARQMSGLIALTKETGNDFDGLTKALSRAGANLAKLTEGSGKGQKALAAMGVTAQFVTQAHGNLGDKMQAVLHQIFATNDEWKRNAALSELLGRGWMENVNTLRLLAEQGYAPAIEKARQFGILFDDISARQAKAFTIALNQMKASVGSFAIVIGKTLIPVIINWMVGMQGIGAFANRLFSLKSTALALIPGIGPVLTVLKAMADASKDSTQAQTDFLTSLDAMTQGAIKAGEDGVTPLTKAVKEHSDALPGLIEREQNELLELSIRGKKEREIQAEYDRTSREIMKATAAGGSYKESLKAQGLALDIYRAKMLDYIKTIRNVIPIPAVGAHMKPLPPPTLALPIVAPYTTPPEMIPPGMLSQLEQANKDAENLQSTQRALNKEYELSPAALKRIIQLLGDLAPYEIVATQQGRELVDWMTRLDRVGAFMTFGDSFKKQCEELRIAGEMTSAEIAQAFTRAIDQIEDQFAHLAVTGKGNFKQIYQELAESIIKSGEQKLISGILGKFRIGGGNKIDGSSEGSALWVRIAHVAGGLFSGKTPGGANEGQPQSTLNKIMSRIFVGKIPGITQATGTPDGSQANPIYTKSAEGGTAGRLLGGFTLPGGEGAGAKGGGGAGDLASSIGSFLSLFSGFLASGGDVMPGKAYVVGEKHPEFFVPRASGTIMPKVTMQQMKPLVYSPTYHISSPDADSFRRSQSQILADGYRTAAIMHSRSS